MLFRGNNTKTHKFSKN